MRIVNQGTGPNSCYPFNVRWIERLSHTYWIRYWIRLCQESCESDVDGAFLWNKMVHAINQSELVHSGKIHIVHDKLCLQTFSLYHSQTKRGQQYCPPACWFNAEQNIPVSDRASYTQSASSDVVDPCFWAEVNLRWASGNQLRFRGAIANSIAWPEEERVNCRNCYHRW